MTEDSPRGLVLVVDDEREMCDLIATALSACQLATLCFTDPGKALEAMARQEVDVVLTDLQMPGMSGLELCQRSAELAPDVPVIVLTAFGSLDSAIGAIRAGAFDFVSKPVELELLTRSVTRALEHRRLSDRVRTLSRQVESAQGAGELLGQSYAMKELRSQIARLAETDSTVLIRGESGSGKELVARSLHSQSARREGPMVAVNCAAVPEALLESELFGHVAGAFTGATRARRGLFLSSDGGTLFLDEVGDLPLELQPKLLRALEGRKTRPVGSDQEVGFDVRLIAATHCDLEAAVRDGEFREDLYYRLNVVELMVPPLRARGSDILLLAQSFLEQCARRFDKQISGMTETAAERLLAYDWPGNVRELENAIERAIVLARHEKLVAEDLPERIRQFRSTRLTFEGEDQDDLMPLAEVERRYIRHVLAVVGGNKTLAAKILGCDRKTLYRKL